MVLHRPARFAFEAEAGGAVSPARKAELRAEILRVLRDEKDLRHAEA